MPDTADKEIDVDEVLRLIADFESTAITFFQDLKEHSPLTESAISLMQEVAQGLAYLRVKTYERVGVDSDYNQ